MIKIGQHIGMGTTCVGLLVEVTDVTPHNIRGRVVNGNWNFTYDFSTCKVTGISPSGPFEFDSNILFTDPIPTTVRGYNDIIYYMDAQLKSTPYTRWMTRTKLRVWSWWRRLLESPTRARNAYNGMREGWGGPLTKPASVDPYDDDIPF